MLRRNSVAQWWKGDKRSGRWNFVFQPDPFEAAANRGVNSQRGRINTSSWVRRADHCPTAASQTRPRPEPERRHARRHKSRCSLWHSSRDTDGLAGPREPWRSCKHGCDDHRSRNEFTLGHSISPYGSKKLIVLAPRSARTYPNALAEFETKAVRNCKLVLN
jgi:hypothetical protein